MIPAEAEAETWAIEFKGSLGTMAKPHHHMKNNMAQCRALAHHVYTDVWEEREGVQRATQREPLACPTWSSGISLSFNSLAVKQGAGGGQFLLLRCPMAC